MPILLSRLSRILEAANIFLERDRILRARVMHTCALVAAGKMTAQAGIDEIWTDIRVTPQYHPAEAVIVEERTRYNLTYKRSVVERERIRLKRSGNQPRQRTTVSETELFPERPPPAEAQLILDRMEAEDKAVDDWLTTPEPTALPEIPDGWTEDDEAEYRKVMGKSQE